MCKDIAIVYWSGTGNTEALANAIASGVKGAGGCADLINVCDANVTAIAEYKKIVLGCPAMGDEVLEDSEFEPFYIQLEPLIVGKSVYLFGSYDWGDGQWMRSWVDSATENGLTIVDTLIVQSAEDGSELASDFGKAMV
ncbi:MAG: flavodoxin domain-containing protein [Christensenellaceae bacterium]|jgi:flavodoxin short chain|nr:flavodoxin domain-containing protein [Christensenellaceae bacterium]